jgi:aldehyde:ferredoxin oxidoreductase
MASSSIHVRDDSDFKSEVREVHPHVSDRNTLECKGVLHHLWTTKCVSLHNEDGVPKENWSQYEVQSYNWNNKTT